MRKIKFRVYVKGVDTGMYYPGMLLVTRMGISKIWGDDYKIKDDTNEFFLMEWIGLNDRNGQPIYEGDIIKSKEEQLAVVVFGSFDTEEGSVQGFFGIVIEYFEFKLTEIGLSIYEDGIPITLSDFSTYGRLPIDPNEDNSCEIVGNIYENAELLKEASNG